MRTKAFSLVEVALALGLVSFVLIALLGLMSTGLKAGKFSTEEMTTAILAQKAVWEVNTNSYAAIASLSFTRYYDFSGAELTNAVGAHYRCDVTTLAHASPDLPTAMDQSTNAVRVRISLFWPATSTKANEVLETTIARY